ncbi:MAG TPA: hypothetical protein VN364_04380 [Bellilinea sp.]|nr:hypothetical protein [Bellilinea sp.]
MFTQLHQVHGERIGKTVAQTARSLRTLAVLVCAGKLTACPTKGFRSCKILPAVDEQNKEVNLLVKLDLYPTNKLSLF